MPLWLLPPYSHDFNPIEQVFAKMKSLLRKAAAGEAELADLAPQPPAGQVGEALHPLAQEGAWKGLSSDGAGSRAL